MPPVSTVSVSRAPASSGSSASSRALAGALPVVSPEARRWFGLAVGSLVIAGLLSLAVVLGRLPVLSRFIDDPLFFKRCLVVHVDLALVVWFYAFLGGLAALRHPRGTGTPGAVAFVTTVIGVGAMLVGALARGAQPVLANYVPVIDHPFFLAGLAAFFTGAFAYFVHHLAVSAGARRSDALPADAATGFAAAAVACVLAGATWVSTRAALPAGLDVWTRYEFSAWGAGHVLQVANAAAMLAVWLWLLARATGRSVLGARGARWLFALLVAPHFAMPVLTARGALDTLYHSGATLLMRWGIFPVVLTVLFLGARHLIRSRKESVAASSAVSRVALTGFFASASLTVLGIVLGACIRSSTTLVPAHYHASLGGVTVAFMTAAYLVAEAVSRDGLRAAVATAARRQLALFGVGQTVFVLGFAIGGAYGLGRKTYATEQHVRSVGEYVGLGVMGVGGLVAVAGGLWFLFLVLREMRGWWGVRAARPEVSHCITP